MTKHHRQGGLGNTHLFLIVLKAGKSKSKLLADSIPGDPLLPCRWPSRCVLTRWKVSSAVPFSSCRVTDPIVGPIIMTSSRPNYWVIQKVHSGFCKMSWENPNELLTNPAAFELWCWRRLLRVPSTARRSN